MEKLYVNIYDNKEEAGEWLVAIPFDENKTLFVQKVMIHNEECLKIKVDLVYMSETYYYPVSRYSIRQVEIFE